MGSLQAQAGLDTLPMPGPGVGEQGTDRDLAKPEPGSWLAWIFRPQVFYFKNWKKLNKSKNIWKNSFKYSNTHGILKKNFINH